MLRDRIKDFHGNLLQPWKPKTFSYSFSGNGRWGRWADAMNQGFGFLRDERPRGLPWVCCCRFLFNTNGITSYSAHHGFIEIGKRLGFVRFIDQCADSALSPFVISRTAFYCDQVNMICYFSVNFRWHFKPLLIFIGCHY